MTRYLLASIDMLIHFKKYSGAGNDFIIIDNRTLNLPLPLGRELAYILCNHQLGFCADGLIFLESSLLADFKMRIFNRDGSEAEMCGNGLRCLGKFIQSSGYPSSLFSIETPLAPAKVHYVQIADDEIIVEMGLPTDRNIFSIPEISHEIHYLDTGVPHAVVFVEDVANVNVLQWGAFVRNHSLFAPSGTNVNFVHLNGSELYLRTFERGVENETLACGTGACATAVVAAEKFQLPSPVVLYVQSGTKLKFYFEKNDSNVAYQKIFLSGPALFLLDGHFNLADFLSAR